MNGVHFATRTLLLNGVEFQAGEVVPTAGLSRHRLKQLVALRALRAVTRPEPSRMASTGSSGEPMAEVAVVSSEAHQSLSEPLPALVSKRRKRNA